MTSPPDRRAPAAGPLMPGAPAPDFALARSPEETLSLRDLRGRPVVLVFYPADWSPVCGDQLNQYDDLLPELQRFDAALLGISVDGVWSHAAFARERKLRFPLLSDFEPKGEVARAYGVYRERDGVSERGLFVVDAEGTVAWSHVSPIHLNPGPDGIVAALESLAGKRALP